MSIELIFIIILVVIAWFAYKNDKEKSHNKVKKLEEKIQTLKQQSGSGSTTDTINQSVPPKKFDYDNQTRSDFIKALDQSVEIPTTDLSSISENLEDDYPDVEEADKYKAFLKNSSDIFMIEKVNPKYKNGIKNYKGYRIDLDDFRKHNLSKGRPAHYGLPYTPEEIKAVQSAYKEGKSTQELEQFFQRRESVLNKMVSGEATPSKQFLDEDNQYEDPIDEEDPRNIEITPSENIEASELSEATDMLQSLKSMIESENPLVEAGKRFLTTEIMNLLIEKRPNTKKRLLMVLGSRRVVIDQDEFANNYQYVIDILSDVTPEIIDEANAAIEDTYQISRDEGRIELYELREKYRESFPIMASEYPEDELLRDGDIEFHLSHVTEFEFEKETTAIKYFTHRLSPARKARIVKSIEESGYELSEAYSDWLDPVFDVLLRVDHSRVH